MTLPPKTQSPFESAPSRPARTLPVGAEIHPEGIHFRVWAPHSSRVQVRIEGGHACVELHPEQSGHHSGWGLGLGAGTRYGFLLDGRGPFPDPASRFQPDGPHGPSEAINPDFGWTDRAWDGLGPSGQVLYELHVGTLTPEGTWDAALAQLPRLRDLGITAVEVMPVADFPGRFGWGYDGVNLFAPTRLYGRPEDFRRFVDRAHALGLGVVLDVVYNHFGPDGNYLGEFSKHYFTDRHPCPWGRAINFDGPDSAPVREYYISNAVHWLREYHVDGLRLDATHAIFDASEQTILAAIQKAARQAVRPRRVYLTAENELQESALARSCEEGGSGLDALWNDDFHHAARVALAGCRESYLRDYRGTPQELLSSLRWGFLFQGQRVPGQQKPRGTPALGLPSTAFINFLENHDQVANAGLGKRLWQLSSPGRYRALTAAFLLAPGTPLLFQGQEFASSRPFHYFADYPPPLWPAVARGRIEFLSRAPSLAAAVAELADPTDPSTFESSKLDLSEIERHGETVALHRDLLRLRKQDAALGPAGPDRVHGAILTPEAFLLRWLHPAGDRLLLVNLGADYAAVPAPEPLLAPPEGADWELAWSSESTSYGGRGVPPLYQEGALFLPGPSALYLRPGPRLP